MKGRDGLFGNILNEVMSNVEEVDAKEARIEELITFYKGVLEGSNPYDAILKVAEEHELKPEEVFEMLKAGGHVNKETLDELKETEEPAPEEEVEEVVDEAAPKEPKAEKPKELKSDGDTGKLKSMEGKTDEAAPKEPKAEKPKELGKGKKDLGKMQPLKSAKGGKMNEEDLSTADLGVLARTIDMVLSMLESDEKPDLQEDLRALWDRLDLDKHIFAAESIDEKATPKGLRAKAKKADKEATKLKAKDDKAGAKKATKQAKDLRAEADKLEKDLAKKAKAKKEGKVPEEGKDDEATKIEKLTEQGGEPVGPIEIEDGDFDTLVAGLDLLGDIAPELHEFEGEGNVTLIVTDGTRFMGIDPQGYDYPRYKTLVVDSEEAVRSVAKNPRAWQRKHTESKLTEGEMAKEVDALVKQTKTALDDGNYQEAMDLASRLSQIKDALPSAGPTEQEVEPSEFSEPTPPEEEPVVPPEHEMERESVESTEEETQQAFLMDDNLQEMIDTALDAGGSFTEVSEAEKKKSAKKRQRGDAVFQSDHPKVTDDADHFPINSENQARNALARANQYKKAPKWFDGSLDALVKAVAKAVKKKYKSIDVSKAAEKPGKG